MGTGYEEQEGQHGEFCQTSLGLERLVDKHSQSFGNSIILSRLELSTNGWTQYDLAVNSIQQHHDDPALPPTYIGAFSFGHVVLPGRHSVHRHPIIFCLSQRLPFGPGYVLPIRSLRLISYDAFCILEILSFYILHRWSRFALIWVRSSTYPSAYSLFFSCIALVYAPRKSRWFKVCTIHWRRAVSVMTSARTNIIISYFFVLCKLYLLGSSGCRIALLQTRHLLNCL